MKYLAVLASLFFATFVSHATHSNLKSSVISPKTKVIAERLADKSISDILQIVLKLQSECQKKNSLDVCEGVMNIVDVVHYRVNTMPSKLSTKNIAFIQGVMDGVEDANSKMIAALTQLN